MKKKVEYTIIDHENNNVQNKEQYNYVVDTFVIKDLDEKKEEDNA